MTKIIFLITSLALSTLTFLGGCSHDSSSSGGSTPTPIPPETCMDTAQTLSQSGGVDESTLARQIALLASNFRNQESVLALGKCLDGQLDLHCEVSGACSIIKR